MSGCLGQLAGASAHCDSIVCAWFRKPERGSYPKSGPFQRKLQEFIFCLGSLWIRWKQNDTLYLWPQEMSLCPATCWVRVQPPSSWCCSLGEMLWIEFWISSSLTQLTHFSRPHLKQELNWPPQYKGPLDSVKKFLRSFAKQPQSLWSSICLSSSARAAWEIYISQEMHLQSLFQLFFLKKSFFFSQSH